MHVKARPASPDRNPGADAAAGPASNVHMILSKKRDLEVCSVPLLFPMRCRNGVSADVAR